jgi:hypothetical protein
MNWIDKEAWDKHLEFKNKKELECINFNVLEALDKYPYNLSDEDFEKYMKQLQSDE